MFRRNPKAKKPTPIDTSQIPARWRSEVDDCLRFGTELAALAQRAPDGAVKERLVEFNDAAHAQLTEVAAIATRSAELLRLTQTLDVGSITASYKRARRENSPDADLLERQHASAQRLLNALDDVDAHLAAATLRVRELVLAAGELSLSGSELAIANVRASVDALADEASALRDALGSIG